jgi:hypothetical protein
MSFNHADWFIVLFCSGAGLALVGGLNALAGRLAAGWRAILTGIGCAVALSGVSLATSDPNVLTAAAVVMAAGVVSVWLAGSTSLVELLRRAAALSARPGVRWGLLTVVGLGTAVTSAAWYEYEDNARTDRDMRELGLEYGRPSLIESEGAVVRTDRGAPVQVKTPTTPRGVAEISEAEKRFLQTSPFRDQMMRRQKADDGSNCHGWVFTGGRFWLEPGAVELALAHNGYVDVTAPRPGDLVIYRTDGAITHTGVVRYVSDGTSVLVESKWGAMGVYVHPADQSPYGNDPTFYRSARVGHLLVGLDDSPLSVR